MPLVDSNDRFFLLVLSKGEVRFFEGHRYSITPVKINDLVPANFEEAMSVEDPEKSLQFYNSGPNRGNDSQDSIHHGHGIHKDQRVWQLETYCRMVDSGLMEMLHDEKAPMIIGGVEDIVAIYQDVSNYKYIVDENVSGNLEEDDPVLLHEKAWSKMKLHFKEGLEQQKEKFDAAMARNEASSTILDIVPAAINGRIDTLFLSKDVPVVWGEYKL